METKGEEDNKKNPAKEDNNSLHCNRISLFFFFPQPLSFLSSFLTKLVLLSSRGGPIGGILSSQCYRYCIWGCVY